MKTISCMASATIIAAIALASAAPAYADPDTDFANELHTYGMYGPKDENAWIGKIMCKRLWTGLDANATQSATFLHNNLQRGASEQQIYEFMSAAMNYYCPDQRPVLDSLAGQYPATPSPPSPPSPTGGYLPAEQPAEQPPAWAPPKPAEFWEGQPVVWTSAWGGRWGVWINGGFITLSSNPVTGGG